MNKADMESKKLKLATLLTALLLLPLTTSAQSTGKPDTLGKAVLASQSIEGDYWVQLAALKNAEAVKKLIAKNQHLNYKIHTDKKGLVRLMAGPYRSFAEANTMRRKLNKREAFIRFTEGNVLASNKAPKSPPQETVEQPQQNAKQRVDLIKASKQRCVEVFEQPAKRQANSDCICCIRIKGNQVN